MTTARQQQDEEPFSVNPEEQKAMAPLGEMLKPQREIKPYDLQNLPFDPAVEARKASQEEDEDSPDLALKRLYKVFHQYRAATGRTYELSPSLKAWLKEMESRSTETRNSEESSASSLQGEVLDGQNVGAAFDLKSLPLDLAHEAGKASMSLAEQGDKRPVRRAKPE